MNDAQTTILYTLSTLAQTCAALAAFVGAVGIFRLQNLGSQRIEAEREFRALISRLVHRDPLLTPINEFVAGLHRELEKHGDKDANVQAAMNARDRWNAFVPRRHSNRVALVAFEVWNLVVIGTALVGFNYVPALAVSPWTFWGIWVVAVGTVGITAYCVFLWTRE